MRVSPEKFSQLAHVLFLGDLDGVKAHMRPSRTVRAKKDVDSEPAPAAETPAEELAAKTGKEDGSEEA